MLLAAIRSMPRPRRLVVTLFAAAFLISFPQHLTSGGPSGKSSAPPNHPIIPGFERFTQAPRQTP